MAATSTRLRPSPSLVVVSAHDVEVDNGEPLEVLLARGGPRHPDITTGHFPHQDHHKGVTITRIFLVGPGDAMRFAWSVSSKEVEDGLGLMVPSLRPAGPRLGISLGLKFPEFQLVSPIVCLGQTWEDRNQDTGFMRRLVVCLSRLGTTPIVDLFSRDLHWGRHCLFAAVEA